MNDLMQSIDERSKLGDSNHLEALLSSIVRGPVSRCLDHLDVSYANEVDGEAVWKQLNLFASRAEQSGRRLLDDVKLVIADIEMPRMDGYVVTKNLKNDPRVSGCY